MAWGTLLVGVAGLAVWCWMMLRHGVRGGDVSELLVVTGLAVGEVGMVAGGGWLLHALRTGRRVRAAFVTMIAATTPSALFAAFATVMTVAMMAERGPRRPLDVEFWLLMPAWTLPCPIEVAALLLWILGRHRLLAGDARRSGD